MEILNTNIVDNNSTCNSNNQSVNKEIDINKKNSSHQKEETNIIIDWAKLKAEYITGAGPKFLSEKYKIPIETIRSRIKREGWNVDRTEINGITQLRVKEKYSELLIDIQIQAREQYRNLYSKLRNKLCQYIDICTDSKEVITIIKALAECQKGEFKSLGISEFSDSYLFKAIDPNPVEDKSASPFHGYVNEKSDYANLIKSMKLF